MSAKYLYTIADENPDLHNQLGCMHGLFQIFNRQNFIAGRRFRSQSRKRLPQGESDNHGKEPKSNITRQQGTETNLRENAKEREGTLLESSESSFSSSSCSSTFSPTDFKKCTQLDPIILGHTAISKTPHVVPKKQLDPSFKPIQQSPDIGNTVEDPIQRDKSELSVKTKTKLEGKTRVMKHIDSPRPQQVELVSPGISTHDRSPRVLGRERNSALPSKDDPRFSYDERGSREKWKIVTKLREVPRFSLDSRESSIQRVDSESRSNSILENLHQRRDQRLSSVVAKLMGLEAFPDLTDTNKSRHCENLDPVSTSSSKNGDKNKHNQISNSPRLTPRDALSPKLRNINSTAKPNTRSPLEPAPWREKNDNQEPQNSTLEFRIKPQTVYGQIEKRLTEIEFKKSDKDLRALKQILEAMQKTKASIKDEKDESSNKQSQSSNGSNSPKRSEVPKIAPKPKNTISSSLPMPGLRKLKAKDNTDTKKEMIPKKTEFRESSQFPRHVGKRSSTATHGSKQTSVSPRMQQNKYGVEQYHNITHRSETSTSRRTVDRQHPEKISPSSKIKTKLCVRQQRDEDQLSEVNSEKRCLSHQDDAFSARIKSNISIISQNDEVTSNYKSEVAARLNEFRSKTWITLPTLEQPSPVSVLDTTLYEEELPSPVKNISTAFTDEENLSSDEAETHLVDPVNFVNSIRPDLVPELDLGNIENIKHLNEKVNPTHKYVAEILSASGLFKDLSCSSIFTQLHPSVHLINPDLFHILEQAKSKTQVEDEESRGKMNQSELYEKIHRKLVFDTTDEILVHILISTGFSDPCFSSNKLGLKSFTGERLLEKICSEIYHLQTNPECSLPYKDDVIESQVPGIVLDIERLIFKDLICEIVSGEASLPIRLNKLCRQLFTN